MSALIELRDLQVNRGRTALLRGLSWRVQRGEHWVILGPNGCGKTTLLKALTGYLSPGGGDISLLGQRYGECDWRELRFELGMVTSAFVHSIPPAETAEETVMSGRYAQLDLWHPTTPSDRRRARQLLARVGAGMLAERPWVHLSQGERQRVLIARALMARPRLLILDEPCAGLDPVAREHFLGIMDGVARARGGPALVLVTHHVEEITPAFTHALLLRAGSAVAAGPLRATLTSAGLSAAFGARMRLRRQAGRYRLEAPRGPGLGT